MLSQCLSIYELNSLRLRLPLLVIKPYSRIVSFHFHDEAGIKSADITPPATLTNAHKRAKIYSGHGLLNITSNMTMSG